LVALLVILNSFQAPLSTQSSLRSALFLPPRFRRDCKDKTSFFLSKAFSKIFSKINAQKLPAVNCFLIQSLFSAEKRMQKYELDLDVSSPFAIFFKDFFSSISLSFCLVN
jgi:hypothetical protein